MYVTEEEQEETDDSLVNHSPCKWRTIFGRGISVPQGRCGLGSDSRLESEFTHTVSLVGLMIGYD
jgi:hypothetical protein